MMEINNKKNLYISIAANVVLLIIVVMLLKACSNNYKNDYIMTDQTKIKIEYDTIIKTDTAYKAFAQPKKIKPTIILVDTNNSGLFFSVKGLDKQLSNSLFYYSDTNRNEDLTIIINDSIKNSEIVSRFIIWNDRRPEIIKTITKEIQIPPKKEFPIRAYLGIYGYGNKKANWGVGPSAIMTTKFGIAAMYSYDVHNQQHTAGLYYMLKFKK